MAVTIYFINFASEFIKDVRKVGIAALTDQTV